MVQRYRHDCESSNFRPRGITALAVFFAVGAAISGTTAISLLAPGSFLEPMWQLNPRAHVALSSLGLWGPILLASVSCACAVAAIGLWRLSWWGYRIAIGLLVINGIGDVVNVITGTEPRAAVGIPIVLALLFYLTRPGVRAAFMKR